MKKLFSPGNFLWKSLSKKIWSIFKVATMKINMNQLRYPLGKDRCQTRTSCKAAQTSLVRSGWNTSRTRAFCKTTGNQSEVLGLFVLTGETLVWHSDCVFWTRRVQWREWRAFAWPASLWRWLCFVDHDQCNCIVIGFSEDMLRKCPSSAGSCLGIGFCEEVWGNGQQLLVFGRRFLWRHATEVSLKRRELFGHRFLWRCVGKRSTVIDIRTSDRFVSSRITYGRFG